MQNPEYVKSAFARIADRYIITNHILSLGTDILWRKKVSKIVKHWNPSQLLDIATGTGDLALELQKAIPTCHVTGSDFCPEMLAYATSRGVKKTIEADALNLPFEDESYDAVTVAFGLRNMANWETALKEMARVLKPQGHLLILDFSIPQNILKAPYTFYLDRILPKLAGAITKQPDAYHYLSGSIQNFPSGEKMTQLVNSTGFQHTQTQSLSYGIASVYTAKKQDS